MDVGDKPECSPVSQSGPSDPPSENSPVPSSAEHERAEEDRTRHSETHDVPSLDEDRQTLHEESDEAGGEDLSAFSIDPRLAIEERTYQHARLHAEEGPGMRDPGTATILTVLQAGETGSRDVISRGDVLDAAQRLAEHVESRAQEGTTPYLDFLDSNQTLGDFLTRTRRLTSSAAPLRGSETGGTVTTSATTTATVSAARGEHVPAPIAPPPSLLSSPPPAPPPPPPPSPPPALPPSSRRSGTAMQEVPTGASVSISSHDAASSSFGGSDRASTTRRHHHEVLGAFSEHALAAATRLELGPNTSLTLEPQWSVQILFVESGAGSISGAPADPGQAIRLSPAVETVIRSHNDGMVLLHYVEPSIKLGF